ncbi:MAG: hypothetical protein GX033_07305 [Firmicutes bacterium]|nr:hypothetical protein [Bacillota bacterium]
MNAFTTIAVANRAPLLTDMHKEEPLLRLHGFDPDMELPLLIRYRGQDAPEKAAAIDPPALVLVIGEVLRSTKRNGRKRPALVVEAQELSVIPLEVTDSLSLSLSWEVRAHSFAMPELPFLDADDEGNTRRRF